MFASPNLLGFDPTVTLVWPFGPHRRYDIVVRHQDDDGSILATTFRTEKLISNVGAQAIRGRGTRVWRVRKLLNGKVSGKTMVLKDCWIYSDQKREADVLEEIKASARDDDDRRVFNRHLLTVVCHGDVYIDEETDSTSRGAKIPVEHGWYDLGHVRSQPGQATNPPVPIGSTMATISTDLSAPRTAAQYENKIHYRIVFTEVAEPIDSIRSACFTFFYLSQILNGALCST